MSFDVYLYNMENPHVFTKIPDISFDDAMVVASEHWNRSDSNDVVIMPEGDDPFVEDSSFTVLPVTFEDWMAEKEES